MIVGNKARQPELQILQCFGIQNTCWVVGIIEILNVFTQDRKKLNDGEIGGQLLDIGGLGSGLFGSERGYSE